MQSTGTPSSRLHTYRNPDDPNSDPSGASDNGGFVNLGGEVGPVAIDGQLSWPMMTNSGSSPGTSVGALGTVGAGATAAAMNSSDTGTMTSNSGLAITISYDPSTLAAPAAFFTDVQAVVNYFENMFSNLGNTVSFTLHVGYGEVNGSTMGPGALGQSNYFLHSYSYSQIRTALINNATTADDAAAIASLPATDPDPNSHTWWVGDTEGEALGLYSSNSINDYVGFANTSNATFDYDRSNGITPGEYDFIGTVAHELSEVLGRQLGVNENDINNAPSTFIEDLFHYSSNGTRDWSRGGYFSIDGGATDLADFNALGSGDAGDWGGATVNDSYLAFSNSGVYNEITLPDLRLMDVLGYTRTDDYGSDPNFAGEMSVNGSTTGTIDYTGDRDWFRVYLYAGQSYRIDENGAPSSQGTLPDSYLRLYNSSSVQVAADDDSYVGGTFSLDSELLYTPSTSGYYYVAAGAFNDAYTGTYTVHVTQDDYPANILTPASVAVGGHSTGNIETASDHDWFRVSLTAGTTYILREDGSPVGLGSLSDPYMYLYDSAGNLITQNDDSGPGLDSRIVYTPTSTGTYYIGAAAFSSNTGTYTVSATEASLPAASDFNSDAHSDMLWRYGPTGAVDLWEMNGNQITSNLGVLSPDTSWSIIDIGDVNGDGYADILWQNSGSGAMALWEMNGNQVISNTALPTVNSPWVEQGIGDFNGDSTGDVLWRYASTGALDLWEMNGSQISSNSGLFYNGSPINPTPDWHVVALADFDRNGTTDVLWRYAGTGAVALWEMSGNTVTSISSVVSPDLSWHVIGTGDFYGNGGTDVIWQHDSGAIDVWEMNGNQIVAQFGLPTVTSNWSIAQVGDFTGSGRSDIVWRDSNSGAMVMWDINANNANPVTSMLGINNPSAAWTLPTHHFDRV